ncbi:GPH family glycoside/pentoside/hexuronide:cation symporter [Aequitasia blattaphilus]|uniref:Glycoside-pentoside-hexuronide (GPH):cation symporter n=1 Tax=Aequitasia blattaphilus TaxID=2949332 RepID=A0ABT1EBX2_9FIRM|nr:glycoside-pentoside-hexuronide (GPH):cation symporter [Aequitasia blattaphilus]MCP1103339.1 glycoside-pentoside-hexuronide (GPH):cation symporter [Aequitasia blattaphilus]MCR8615979.1 glycoside-pentoside-hexuronide (GPH):cation symporter [Aequitasia blattaphilus]
MSKNMKDPANWEKTSSQYGYYKLARKEVWGYSSIDFAMNLVFQCIALYISYFYTDIFGIRPGHVAILFAVSRLWDAINDPLMGTICERLSFKKGKYWIYIMWGAIPFGVAAVLTYTTPDFSYGMKLVWAAITYNLLNMLYTFIIQPYISAASLMTNDQNERTRLQSTRMMLAQSGGVVCAIMLPNLSGFLTKYMTLAQGYMVTTAIMAAVMVIILLWGSHQIIERVPAPPVDPNNKANIKDVFRLLFTVGPVFIMFLLFLGVYTLSQVQSTMGAYYIKYYAGREDMLSWFSMMMMLPSVAGVPCVPWLTRRIKKKGTVMLGLVLAAIGALVLYFMPPGALGGMLAARAITSFGYGILMGILWSIITDPVEYADWKTGKRYTAIVMTLIGLGIKFAMIIGGSLPTAVMESAGYVANEVQTEAVVQTIRNLTTLLPLAVIGVTIVIFGIFYRLDEETVSDIQQKIADRNAQRENLS